MKHRLSAPCSPIVSRPSRAEPRLTARVETTGKSDGKTAEEKALEKKYELLRQKKEEKKRLKQEAAAAAAAGAPAPAAASATPAAATQPGSHKAAAPLMEKAMDKGGIADMILGNTGPVNRPRPGGLARKAMGDKGKRKGELTQAGDPPPRKVINAGEVSSQARALMLLKQQQAE
eukprot:CAMPEP_0118926066 /NCGR_PEP_ID=MMETSP1169-20130426/3848_1 /TAXON_ID=36882 /ORGANISM="Pyramimonas obovata, Strain CCMP722" /LENGTH=174 /DNA_ID=CAMNT_0006867535 /DNA_START=56 /DNA_END=579 /DNA_ORIENTATION=-